MGFDRTWTRTRTHRDVVKQPEGGAAAAAGGADVVRVAADRASQPLAAAVGPHRHHLSLLVPQVDRSLHAVPAGIRGCQNQNRATLLQHLQDRAELSLGDEHQHAVVSDGVDDGVGHAARVLLRVSLFEEEALEEADGRALGPLGCLQTPELTRSPGGAQLRSAGTRERASPCSCC